MQQTSFRCVAYSMTFVALSSFILILYCYRRKGAGLSGSDCLSRGSARDLRQPQASTLSAYSKQSNTDSMYSTVSIKYKNGSILSYLFKHFDLSKEALWSNFHQITVVQKVILKIQKSAQFHNFIHSFYIVPNKYNNAYFAKKRFRLPPPPST